MRHRRCQATDYQRQTPRKRVTRRTQPLAPGQVLRALHEQCAFIHAIRAADVLAGLHRCLWLLLVGPDAEPRDELDEGIASPDVSGPEESGGDESVSESEEVRDTLRFAVARAARALDGVHMTQEDDGEADDDVDVSGRSARESECDASEDGANKSSNSRRMTWQSMPAAKLSTLSVHLKPLQKASRRSRSSSRWTICSCVRAS